MPEAARRPPRLKSLRATRKWSAKVAPGTPASQWPSLAAAAMQAGLGLQTEEPEEELSIDVDVELPPEPSVVVEQHAAAAAPQVVAEALASRGHGPSGTVRMKSRPWPAATVLIRRRREPLPERLVWLASGAAIAIFVMALTWLLLARF